MAAQRVDHECALPAAKAAEEGRVWRCRKCDALWKLTAVTTIFLWRSGESEPIPRPRHEWVRQPKL